MTNWIIVLCGVIVMLTIICCVLSTMLSIKLQAYPGSAICIRGEDLQKNIFKRTILKDEILAVGCGHTGIYYSITPTFGKNKYCHEAFIFVTKSGRYYLISPKTIHSIDVHEVKRNYFYRVGSDVFIRGGELGKYWLENGRLYKVDLHLTVEDVIHQAMHANKPTYQMFSFNCQYFTNYLISWCLGVKVPLNGFMSNVFDIMSDFVFGDKFDVRIRDYNSVDVDVESLICDKSLYLG